MTIVISIEDEYTAIYWDFYVSCSVFGNIKARQTSNPPTISLGMSASDTGAYLSLDPSNQWNDLQLLCVGRRPDWRNASSLPIPEQLMKLTKSGRSKLTCLINYLYEAE